jgi:hypothetical protein
MPVLQLSMILKKADQPAALPSQIKRQAILEHESSMGRSFQIE